MKITHRLATNLMRWGSRQARFGRQECYTESFVKPAPGQISVATEREFADGASFFEPFAGTLGIQDLSAKDVLDIGCGHGGRTAYYLLHGNPRSIVGVEINSARVGVARQSVGKLCDDERISFVVGVGEQLPLADESFDIILSYDVFEHVQDLPRVLQECYRVLRPGGRLYALFPPYYGPRAHHLDFVTSLPFLHHLFSPETLVGAANQILKEQPQLRDEPLPRPRRSYQGRRVLPRLNGTTERDFRRLVAASPFEGAQITLLPFAWGPGGATKGAVRAVCHMMLHVPLPFTRDLFVGTVRAVLRKH
jgi:SAM-dependent methyltransferase